MAMGIRLRLNNTSTTTSTKRKNKNRRSTDKHHGGTTTVTIYVRNMGNSNVKIGAAYILDTTGIIKAANTQTTMQQYSPMR